MDSGGWVSFSKVSRLLGLTKDEIVHIVRADSKGRFQLMKASWCRPDAPNESIVSWIAGIRAVASHSIPWINPVRNLASLTDELMKYVSCAVHGTQKELIGDILSQGLVPGGPDRAHNFTHLSPHSPWSNEYRHGIKHNANTYIFVDLARLRETQNVWVSAQGVLMCSAVIPPDLFLCIMLQDASGWRILWHKDLATSELAPGTVVTGRNAYAPHVTCAKCAASLKPGFVECPCCTHQLEYMDVAKHKQTEYTRAKQPAELRAARKDYFGEYSGRPSLLSRQLKYMRQLQRHTIQWAEDPTYRNTKALKGWTKHFNFPCTEPWCPDSADALPDAPVHCTQQTFKLVLMSSFMLGGIYSTDPTHSHRIRFVEALCRLPTDGAMCAVGDFARAMAHADDGDLADILDSFVECAHKHKHTQVGLRPNTS